MCSVLDRSELFGRDIGIVAGVEHVLRPQKAADVVGAVHGMRVQST